MRHPGRTAVTASALMIGVMLVTAVTVVANGLRQETKGTLDDRIAASHVITAQDGWSPMDPQVARTAAGVPGVTAVSALRQDGGLVAGDKEVVNGVDGATIGKVFDFEWKDGSNRVLSGLGADGAVVDDGWASEHGLKVGDAFTVTSVKGVKLPLTVRGIEDSPVLDSLGARADHGVQAGVRPRLRDQARPAGVRRPRAIPPRSRRRSPRSPTRTCSPRTASSPT